MPVDSSRGYLLLTAVMQKLCLYVAGGIFCGIVKCFSVSCPIFSCTVTHSVPANDVLVAANDCGLNVGWMVAEPSDTESLLQ